MIDRLTTYINKYQLPIYLVTRVSIFTLRFSVIMFKTIHLLTIKKNQIYTSLHHSVYNTDIIQEEPQPTIDRNEININQGMNHHYVLCPTTSFHP